jgi:hypothetical protein
MRFGVGLATVRATEALQAVAMLAETAALHLTGGAGHRDGFRLHTPRIQQALAVVNSFVLVLSK